MYCAVWITFAVWKPWNLKHIYDVASNLDRFRFSLFIIGAIMSAIFIYEELKQVHNEYKYEKEIFYVTINLKNAILKN